MKNLQKLATKLLLEKREIIERYIRRYPLFQTTLIPFSSKTDDPFMIRKMTEAGKKMGVGPMAAVAGAIAQEVAVSLAAYSQEMIVENGGDIYLQLKRKSCIAIHAGFSPFNKKLGIELEPSPYGVSVCTSSGTVGHSFSYGKADAAIAISKSAYLADAAATAMGNVIQTEEDIGKGIKMAQSTPGILGALIIKNDKLSLWGKLKLVPIDYEQ
ncbi:MAG: UPF0280 family protein [bacterium]